MAAIKDRTEGRERTIWIKKGSELIITDYMIFACCKTMQEALTLERKGARTGKYKFTDNCIRSNDEALGINRNWNARRSLEEGRDLTQHGADGLMEVMMQLQL